MNTPKNTNAEAIADLKDAGHDLMKAAAVLVLDEERFAGLKKDPKGLAQLLDAMEHWHEVNEANEDLTELMNHVRAATRGFRIQNLISELRRVLPFNTDPRRWNLRGTGMALTGILRRWRDWTRGTDFGRRQLNEDHVRLMEDAVAEVRDDIIIERPNGYPDLNLGEAEIRMAQEDLAWQKSHEEFGDADNTNHFPSPIEVISKELGRELTEAEVKKVRHALNLSFVPKEIVTFFRREAANDTVPAFWMEADAAEAKVTEEAKNLPNLP